MAFEQAISSVSKGVIFIPAGTYIISKKINITKGNLVFRGAGQGKTVLYFPKSLTDLWGNNPNTAGQSQWSFGPGLISVTGMDPISSATRIAQVTAPAKRGDPTLTVSSTSKLNAGEWVRLVESDPKNGNPASGTLIHYLYGDIMSAGFNMSNLLGTANAVRFLSRIQRISGNEVELERPLPYDVRGEWTPEFHAFAPTLTEVGFENLSIHFPWTAYPGHFKEAGYNALIFSNVSQCWAKNIEIQNSDIGIGLNHTNFCTLSGIILDTSADRAVGGPSSGWNGNQWNGHHGIDVSHGTENLITHFKINTRFVHDISLEGFALHTVYSDGSAIDLNMDHHRQASYSNLFSNLDCGEGKRPFASGGSGDRGPHAGAYETYWNIQGRSSLSFPAADFGPLLNFVGFQMRSPAPFSPYQWFIETIAPATLCPIDLHQAMRQHRLNKSGP